MGGRFPQDPNPTWNGYSTGHWDGDTLVVETIGFRDDLWLDASGNPLTQAGKNDRKNPAAELRDARSRDHDQRSEGLYCALDGEDDQPLVLDSELIDYYCLENEKDSVHMK